MKKLEQLQQIILAEAKSLFLVNPKISDNYSEEVKQPDSPYDINALFYAGLSLPTDIYTIPYDQVNIPFENAFFAYLNEGESQLLAALKWAPDKNFGQVDFFNVSFENLFDIPVDERAEEAYITSQEKNEAGIESFEQSLLINGFEDTKSNFLTARVTSLERALSAEAITEVPLATPPVSSPVTNDSPVAQDSSFFLFQNQLSTFAFSASDNSGLSALSFRVVSYPSLGQVFINSGTNTFTYDPGNAFDFLSSNQTETVSFTYQASDPQGATSLLKTISLTVTGENDAPVANPDVASVNENDSSVFINVLSNDTEIDAGDTLSLVSATIIDANFDDFLNFAPLTIALASVQMVGNQIEFSPGTDFDFLTAGQYAKVNISYTMEDDLGVQSTSSVTVTVNGVGTDYVVDDPISMFFDNFDGNYTKGNLSLIEAVNLANVSAFPAVISFDPTITVINTDVIYFPFNDITFDGGAGGMPINYFGITPWPFFIDGTGADIDITFNNIILTSPVGSILAVGNLFTGASITLNGFTEINTTSSDWGWGIYMTNFRLFLNDSSIINAGSAGNATDYLGVAANNSFITLNDFSGIFGVSTWNSTIDMYDSTFILGTPGISLYLDASTLNIYDPAPMNDGTHPIVGPEFTFAPSVINIYDHGILPASAYITSTTGAVTINLLPIILDLNGDGIHLVSPEESGMTLANFSNGQNTDKIGWMSPGDGMLVYDYDQDGKVTHIDEFTLASYALNAKTDLEGLQLFFDTNKDNVFDSNDEYFSQFGVWQDSNSNGITDQNEFHTLSELNITSINLISDQQSVLENGNTIFGYSTYVTADGNTHQLADVGLRILPDSLIDSLNTHVLQGSAGADVFTLSPLDSDVNHVIIPDFNPDEGDVLKIDDVLHVLESQEDVLSALDSQASFSHPSIDSTLVTFDSGDTLLINININTFHDSALETQIVVDQPVLA